MTGSIVRVSNRRTRAMPSDSLLSYTPRIVLIEPDDPRGRTRFEQDQAQRTADRDAVHSSIVARFGASPEAAEIIGALGLDIPEGAAA